MGNTISCQFVFEPGEYDDEFHQLDGQIDLFASELSGFISVHRWVSPDGRLKNSIYFFQDMESVKELAKFPQHLVAKREVKRWYKSYQILITEVVASYGDGNLIYP
jgi:heme-degrading monooxygenase HmoA